MGLCKPSYPIKFSELGNPAPVEGRFLRRLNRFVAEVMVDGETAEAHLPNPGRLLELLFPGQTVYLLPSQGAKRYKIHGTLRNGDFVHLDTVRMNRVAEALIDRGLIPQLEGFRVTAREVRYHHSRFDLLLEGPSSPMVLEVKCCTLFNSLAAFFPDAPSERGTKHLRHLAEMDHMEKGVLFLVQSTAPKAFLPDWHTDPDFAGAFVEASKRGVRLMAAGISMSPSLELLAEPVEIPIPIEPAIPHMADRGSYCVIMKLEEDTDAEVGALGVIRFERGYYVYVGSGMGGLTSRMARHLRGHKTMRWHVDYLSSLCTAKRAFPIRADLRLECLLADRMARLGGRGIARFGSSDCGCESHLFHFQEDPSTQVFEAVLHIRSLIGLGCPVKP
ncbi:sugar fermentation stimulation protein [Thermanaerovibrio velox DSM 12556]|uniref:Sugar fermentation stimulation protein homolog n=1 Tax=Thermanaerovibrio velox DSM 12556 TaxID=926567 RepID=H0UPT0_9BACT|nr:DNA/RNA nuclease SfsA [Thermanaerovibrio velox]EHM10639.1 sugar fermentation stimulation protein [Thermanaerovibrio velox DSM 12556]